MRKKKHNKRSSGGVEMNMAAMLDMAFQLLAFFVLTFQPAPEEAQITLKMPPATPATIQGANSSNRPTNEDPLKGVETVLVGVIARPDGNIFQMAVMGEPVVGLDALKAKLTSLLSNDSSPFDQVQVMVDPRLKWSKLMSIIETCNSVQVKGKPLSKISFASTGVKAK